MQKVGTSRLNELHESKQSFVSLIKFNRSKLSICSAHVSGVIEPAYRPAAEPSGSALRSADPCPSGRNGPPRSYSETQRDHT